jgi:hypothetical protein
LSGFEEEEQRLRRLYDQARIQGDKKKKKEYKEKIAELNRQRKQAQRASRREVEESSYFSLLDFL